MNLKRQDTTMVDLTLCPICSLNLVYPQAWTEMEGDLWRVLLHCPSCDWLGDGIWDHDTIIEFDARLNEAVDDMIEMAELLGREASWSDPT